MLGYLGLTRELLARTRDELVAEFGEQPIHIVLTGGLANAPWVEGLEGVEAIDPALTLEGLVAAVRRGRRGTPPDTVTGREAGGRARAALPLEGRFIVLGVTGSIAAYKAAEVARALQAAGAEVQAAMTSSATHFLGPLTLAALTRRQVLQDPLELLPDERIAHIVAADAADAILVAPATAHWLAAMANGLAGDAITATCLASAAPVIVAPAMDGDMYRHPATRANIATLQGFGYTVVEPEMGALASGQTGQGRLAETSHLVAAVVAATAGRAVRAPDAASRPPLRPAQHEPDLEGRRVLVTAGGTAEPIDPVRYIGNRSTGRMGVAVAEAALARGAAVTLIAGHTSIDLPRDATVVAAETTAAMEAAVLEAPAGLRRPGHGRRRGRFPAAIQLGDQADPRRRPDARAGADRRHPGRRIRPGP